MNEFISGLLSERVECWHKMSVDTSKELFLWRPQMSRHQKQWWGLSEEYHNDTTIIVTITIVGRGH